METVVHIIADSCFLLLYFLCFVFGARNGQRIKRINNQMVDFFILFMGLWYLLSVWTSFTLTQWPRDIGPIDIPLLRFLTGFTLILTLTVLVTYKINQDVLDVFLNVILSVATTGFLLLRVVLYRTEARRAFLYVAIIFFVIFYVHLIREVVRTQRKSPRFVRTILIALGVYFFFYVSSIIWSPLHQNLVDFNVIEVLMTFLDLVIAFFSSLLLVQYSWALVLHPQSTFKAGYLSHQVQSGAMTPTALRDFYHTYIS